MSRDDGATSGPVLVADMAAVLAFAELRGLAVGAVGGVTVHPEDVVRAAVREMVGCDLEQPIREALIARIRLATGGALRARAARDVSGGPPWARVLWPLALGDAAWLDAATDAGARAVPLALEVPAVFAAAVRMGDYVRDHLGVVGRRPAADTRPIGRR